MQVENEYGSFAKDSNYMPFIKEVSVPPAAVSFVCTSRAPRLCSINSQRLFHIFECLQTRGIKELLLTSDNWEGLRYEGMEGGK